MKAGVLDVDIRLVFCNRPGAPVLKRAEEAGIPFKMLDHTTFPDRASFDRAMAEEKRRKDPLFGNAFIQQIPPHGLAQLPVVGELPAVVRRDRAHASEVVPAHEPPDGRDDLVLRDRLDLLDERVARLALREDEQSAFPAPRGDDGVHLPVPEPRAPVHGPGPAFDGKRARVPVGAPRPLRALRARLRVIGRLAVADADVAVLDVVVDRPRVRHVEPLRDHGLARVVRGVSALEYELPEAQRHPVGELHRAALVPVAVVHGVLRLVLRVLPERPAREGGGACAPPAADLAAERGLRQPELSGELVL